tara:strand:- start:948 stop:1265 length:318 start_codon:yes stop_codon:yes gene_type:complete
MRSKKEKQEKVVIENVMDERFSLESFDGILRSLGVIAEGIYTDTLRKDKADLLIKLLGTARMTLSERRKGNALKNDAVTPGSEVKGTGITAAGPFEAYQLPKVRQ